MACWCARPFLAAASVALARRMWPDGVFVREVRSGFGGLVDDAHRESSGVLAGLPHLRAVCQ